MEKESSELPKPLCPVFHDLTVPIVLLGVLAIMGVEYGQSSPERQ